MNSLSTFYCSSFRDSCQWRDGSVAHVDSVRIIQNFKESHNFYSIDTRKDGETILCISLLSPLYDS